MTEKFIHLKHKMKKRMCKKNGLMHEYLGFNRLVIRVAKSGQTEAARKLRKMPRNFQFNVWNEFFYESNLISCFVWADTKEGHKYWQDVSEKLRDYEGYEGYGG